MVAAGQHFWWILLYPLIGAALAAAWCRGAGPVACVAILLSFLHAVAAWMQPWAGPAPVVLHEWLPGIPFGFVFDGLTAQMTLLVTSVGALIHVYSLGYMAKERGLWRYFAYLNLFVFFMLLLVMANNLVLLFAGWEGVGLASYLLIGFHHDRPTVNRCANKAFLYNRAGDAGFLLGTLILLSLTGSVEFQNLTKLEPSGLTLAAVLLLVLGATGKSAQLPLFVWLPDAMVGPTPVSALIHAATMVTAGIYLFARITPLMAFHPEAGMVIVTVGLLTALLGATVALAENDIKRILAWSTISQLGLMFVAAGFYNSQAALFHVTTHGFFKALLFLTAGNVIHALKGEQDLRYMGGLRGKMPKTYWLMTIGGWSLAGAPGLAGFFSKDAILVAASGQPVVFAGVLLVGLLTALYTGRMLHGIFFGPYDRDGHEAHGVMLHTLWPLAAGSVLAGWLYSHDAMHWPVAITAGTVAVVGLWWGPRLWLPGFAGQFLARKWFVNEVYEALIVRRLGQDAAAGLVWTDQRVVGRVPTGAAGMTQVVGAVLAWWDRVVVDGLVHAVAGLVELLSYPARLVQSGRVNHYALVVAGAVAASLGWYWLK
jgi:NADH-quinone oxidoreductase subunit L